MSSLAKLKPSATRRNRDSVRELNFSLSLSSQAQEKRREENGENPASETYVSQTKQVQYFQLFVVVAYRSLRVQVKRMSIGENFTTSQ